MYPSPYILFDGYREQSEWFEGCRADKPAGRRIHPALYVITLAAGLWHYREAGKPAVVTHLLRTRQEQRNLYPDRPGQRSTHEFGRAADLRTRELSTEAALEWANWLNSTFSYLGRAGTRTALVHEVGGHGRHLHLQVGPGERCPKNPATFIAA
jgi:hypothetical protein